MSTHFFSLIYGIGAASTLGCYNTMLIHPYCMCIALCIQNCHKVIITFIIVLLAEYIIYHSVIIFILSLKLHTSLLIVTKTDQMFFVQLLQLQQLVLSVLSSVHLFICSSVVFVTVAEIESRIIIL